MKFRYLIFVLILTLTGLNAAIAAPDKLQEFNVYPNPVVNNELTIKAEIEFNKIEILSIVGLVVYSEELEPSKSVRLGINFQSGIYLLRISYTNKTNFTERIWVN